MHGGVLCLSLPCIIWHQVPWRSLSLHAAASPEAEAAVLDIFFFQLHCMTSVHLCGLAKSFGVQTVIENLDLAIASGAYVVLLGPSGCGKTTTLRMLAGLDVPATGKVFMDGSDVTRIPPRKRDVAMVFQNDGLYPHLTVEQAIRLSLRGRCAKSEQQSRFSDAVRLTGVEMLLGKLPRQLSGGELRRAALTVSVAKKTSIRLLDEPLSGLDGAVRQQLQADILQWHQAVPGTTIHVTHDGGEAMRMADQIAVMSGGCISQIGTPAQVYDQPQTIAVAKAIGIPVMNWLQADLIGGLIQTSNPLEVCVGSGVRVDSADEPIVIGVRPTALRLARDVGEDVRGLGISFNTMMQACRPVKDTSECGFQVDDQSFIAVFDRGGQSHDQSSASCLASFVGKNVALWAPAASIHVFSRSTGQRLKLCDVG